MSFHLFSQSCAIIPCAGKPIVGNDHVNVSRSKDTQCLFRRSSFKDFIASRFKQFLAHRELEIFIVYA